MARIGFFALLLSLSALGLHGAQPAFGAQQPDADESPLDSLIPKEARDRIDRRKEGPEELARSLSASWLRTFNGSREVDLRRRDTSVKQQFAANKCVGLFHTKVGTCSTFGLVAALENALGDGTDLSERHLWSQYCNPSSEAAMRAITSGKGVIEERWWPQAYLRAPASYSAATRFKLFESRLLEDDLQAMVEALDRGSPLYLALNTPSVMYARKAVVPADSGHTGGGHAVAIVGYRLDETVEGGGYLLVKNSWGTSNGENGYQWLAMGYCARKGNYCFAWSIDRPGKN